MGKMKLTKDNRRTGKSGIPNWALTTVVFVIIAAVLLTCVASLVASSGIVLRLSNAVKSEDYKVTGAMMKYYYMLTYNTFTSNYSSYLSYFSLNGLYTPEDHNTMPVGGTADNPNSYDTMFLGNYDGTWFDYFMAQTVTDVKNMLVYCEEADVLGISLTDEEKQSIEDSIDAAILEFRVQNIANGGTGEFSETSCLTAMYGSGVKRSDIRKAIEISTLASKCAEDIYDKIEAAVTEERINEEYNSNNKNYDGVDYFYYRFNINYTELTEGYSSAELETKKDEILAKYAEKIAEIKAIADEAAKFTKLEDLQTYALKYSADNKYDDLLADAKLNSDVLPKEEELKTIKEKIVEAVVTEVMSGKEVTEIVVKENKEGETTTYTVYDIAITAAFAKAIKTLKEDLFTNVTSTKKSYTIEKADYTKDDELSEWAFSDERKEGDVKQIEEGDKLTDGAITEAKDKYYRNTVYFLTSTSDRDETNSRNVAYMLFSSSDTAKKVIEELKTIEGLTEEKFKELATQKGAAGQATWENYLKGEMYSTSFDNWLFDKETKVGSITQTPISMSDGSVMVAYYVADGEIVWKVEVKDAIIEKDYEAREDEMTRAHSGALSHSEWTTDLIGK